MPMMVELSYKDRWHLPMEQVLEWQVLECHPMLEVRALRVLVGVQARSSIRLLRSLLCRHHYHLHWVEQGHLDEGQRETEQIEAVFVRWRPPPIIPKL